MSTIDERVRDLARAEIEKELDSRGLTAPGDEEARIVLKKFINEIEDFLNLRTIVGDKLRRDGFGR